MDTSSITSKFDRIGATLKIIDESAATQPRTRRWDQMGRLTLDVQRDRHGESFVIAGPSSSTAGVEVLDVQPRERHLLLLVREDGQKHKFLCGHDERHWFVAAIPEDARGVSSVSTAMDALKPGEVRYEQSIKAVPSRRRNKRRNEAYQRQGEWFFVPTPDLVVDHQRVLRNEPISRGGGSKAHIVDFCYRTGGITVYLSRFTSEGLTEDQYRDFLRQNPRAADARWVTRQRDARVYVKGKVRHPDHKTIGLLGWHRVFMNTESRAKARAFLVFLD